MEGQLFDEVGSFFFVDVNKLFSLLYNKDTKLLNVWFFLVGLFGDALMKYRQLLSLITIYMRMVYHFVCNYLKFFKETVFFFACLILFRVLFQSIMLIFIFVPYVLVNMLHNQFPYIFAHIICLTEPG